MKQPAYLSSGDRIALISTARKIDQRIFDSAVETFKSWDLEIVPGKNLFAEEHQFAGSDALRLQDLQSAFDDPSISAIICARGGYGTSRIIDEVSWDSFLKLPKWLIGYSDITVLHSQLQVFGVESLHASMPVNFSSNSQESLETLRATLFGESIEYSIESHEFNRKGEAKAEIIGGNLSMLYSLNGTASFPKTDGRILFIEDLDEYLYHIDRMMLTLKRAGHLKNLAGLVVGGMSDMNDNEIPFGKTAFEIIRDAVKEYSFPVCFGFPAGHIDDNCALILGREIELSIDSEESNLLF